MGMKDAACERCGGSGTYVWDVCCEACREERECDDCEGTGVEAVEGD